MEDATCLGLLNERGGRPDKQEGLDPAPLSPASRGERCHQALRAGGPGRQEPHRRLGVLPVPRQHSEAGDMPSLSATGQLSHHPRHRDRAKLCPPEPH